MTSIQIQDGGRPLIIIMKLVHTVHNQTNRDYKKRYNKATT